MPFMPSRDPLPLSAWRQGNIFTGPALGDHVASNIPTAAYHSLRLCYCRAKILKCTLSSYGELGGLGSVVA